MTNDLGCTIGPNVIICRKEAGTDCPGADGGPHYFIWMDGDCRTCMDCGIGQAEALGEACDVAPGGRPCEYRKAVQSDA